MSSMACHDLRLTPMQRAKKHHQHGIYTSIRSVMRSRRESARRFVLHLSFAVSKRGTERRVSGRQRTEAKTQTGKAGSTPFFSRSKKTHTLCGTFLNVYAYSCICVVVYECVCVCGICACALLLSCICFCCMWLYLCLVFLSVCVFDCIYLFVFFKCMCARVSLTLPWTSE